MTAVARACRSGTAMSPSASPAARCTAVHGSTAARFCSDFRVARSFMTASVSHVLQGEFHFTSAGNSRDGVVMSAAAWARGPPRPSPRTPPPRSGAGRPAGALAGGPAPRRPPLADLARGRVLHLDDGLLEVVGRALGAERGTGDVDGGLGPVRPRGGEVPVTPRRVLHLDLDGDGGEVGVAEGA